MKARYLAGHSLILATSDTGHRQAHMSLMNFGFGRRKKR